MKTILYRLVSIFVLFYFLNLFIFYIFFLDTKENIDISLIIKYLIFSLIFFIFAIYLLMRTSDYIVKPIENLIQYFQSFPQVDSFQKVNSKIIEIEQLSNFTINFLVDYAKYLEELNVEKNLLNSLLNNLKEGVLCLNQNGKIIYINDFVKKNFSLNQNFTTQNQVYYEVIKNPSLLDIIFKVLNKKSQETIFFGKKVQENVFEFRNQNNYYQLKYYLIPLDNPLENKNIILNHNTEKLFLFIINNITEEYNTKRLKEDFLQNASHELKTPITSIRGYTETLLSKIEINNNPLYKNFLEGILRNTSRMERIINDMVLISSVESKYYPFQPMELNLSQFFLELNSLSEGILKQKNLKLVYKIFTQNHNIIADPLLLEHLFLNLIHNAARYSEENQVIEIEVDEENSNFIIQVIDYGPGIPDEFKEKVFERFYRIDKDRSRKEGGTGLGLSIVKQIVNIHNGSIKILDNPKGGSIFRILLPKK